MWKDAEAAFKPSDLDVASSQKYVYCRKEIETFTRDGTSMWRWKEKKIPKEDYETDTIINGETQDTADMAYVNSELALAILDI